MDPSFQMPAFETRFDEHHCLCPHCQGTDLNFVICQRYARLITHAEEVSKIVSSFSQQLEMATIVVGPQQTKITCPKALLGFYSEFFDAALYGTFSEAALNTVTMPEITELEIRIFIAWCYTGHIDSHLSGEELWVLGDKLRSPKFANQVMCFLYDVYENDTVRAKTAKYVYENTAPGSLLRKMIVDFVGGTGTLGNIKFRGTQHDISKTPLVMDWYALIAEGGDLVVDVISGGGSFWTDARRSDGSDFDDERTDAEKLSEYLLEETGRPIEDFVNGVARY